MNFWYVLELTEAGSVGGQYIVMCIIKLRK